MSFLRNSAITLAVLAVASLTSAHAQTYDAAGDFEAGYLAQQNPNGVWEYGWTQGLPSVSSPLHLFTGYGAGPDSPAEQNLVDPNNDNLFSPAVNFSTAAFNNGNINVAANTLFATGIGNDGHSDADIVFVAPKSATYALSATFLGVQYGDNADVHIVTNGVSLLDSTITSIGQTDSYTGDLLLTQGQEIDFVIGPNNDFSLHTSHVGLSATLTAAPVPEASTTVSFGVLLALGLGGIAVSRRCKGQVAA